MAKLTKTENELLNEVKELHRSLESLRARLNYCVEEFDCLDQSDIEETELHIERLNALIFRTEKRVQPSKIKTLPKSPRCTKTPDLF